MNTYDIEAEVHKKLDNGSYRVKVKILNSEIQMYINGNVVFEPNEKYQEWFVATPKAYGVRIIEFNGKSPLWKEYKKACIEIVQEYVRFEKLDDVSDIDMKEFENKTKEEIDKELQKAIDALDT